MRIDKLRGGPYQPAVPLARLAGRPSMDDMR